MENIENTFNFQPQFDKNTGLMPVIVQDAVKKDILMMAYTNNEALELSIQTGIAHFYSRSRQSLWKKGESSGSFLKIQSILVDCDQDCLVFIVQQSKGACHTKKSNNEFRRSCFYREVQQKKLVYIEK